MTQVMGSSNCFVVASALSGAFGGLLAWAILYMDGTAGLPGWRWYESPRSNLLAYSNNPSGSIYLKE